MRSRAWLAGAIAVTVATGGAQVASAAPITLSMDVKVHEGATVKRFVVAARSRPGIACGLNVRAGGVSDALPYLRADRRGRATWTWSATRSSPRGRWQFHVRCFTAHRAANKRLVRMLAHGVGRAARHAPLGERSSFRSVHGTVVPSYKLPGADPKGLGGGIPNPFEWHQCTWWAWNKRADVYETAVKAGVRARWDGKDWYANAKRGGLPTGQTPVKGALVSFDAYPGNPYGHVAYVEQVASATHIRVSECNGFTEVCGERWMDPRRQKGRLLGYVYGGSAGDPTSTTPPPAGPAPKLSIVGSCTPSGGTLTSTSSGFTPGGVATIRAWYPDGREYTNIISTSRVRGDGSIGWLWPCAGDPAGRYNTEAIDGQTGRSTGRVPFTIGAPPAPTPTPAPTPAPATTWAEQQGSHGANTFTNPYNASGMGTKVAAYQTVQVSCKVYAPQIASANPDGYWYRIASSPWNNNYYAVANTFWNGDIPGHTPYTHNTDFAVRNC
jgi:surface antigen